MKYLIICDLDGTLLNKSSLISDGTYHYFKTFINEGHYLVLATGRSFNGAIKIYQDLALTTPLICDNGGFITNPTDTSFVPVMKSMPLSLFHELFLAFKDKVASALFNRGEQVYTYKYIKEFEYLINNTTSKQITEGPFNRLPFAPSSIMLLVYNTYFEELDTLIHTTYSKYLLSRNWGSDRKYTIYEIYTNDAHKGAAAQYVIDYLKIPKNNTICFGDGINDIELITNAFHGVAMKNACLELKEVAADITEFNNEDDGVIRYLKKYFDN